MKQESEYKTGRSRKCIPCTKEINTLRQRKLRTKLKKRVYSQSEEAKAKRREYSRKWYAEHRGYYAAQLKKYRKENPEVAAAYNIFLNALRNGTIERPDTCDQCGSPYRIQAHHDDYSKPLAVKWLCVRCHSEIHHEAA